MRNKPCKQCHTEDCAHKRHGRLRAQSFTRAYQQHARAQVKRESLQRVGALGFKALIEKRGFHAAAEVFAKYRRAHPSQPMQIVKSWLDELGVHYLMDEHLKYGVYPDFNLPAHNLIIEVDGAGFHPSASSQSRCEWLGDDRQRRDAMKDELYALEGYRVLRLPESAVRRDGTGKALVQEALR